jgi:hypothetical protein
MVKLLNINIKIYLLNMVFSPEAPKKSEEEAILETEKVETLPFEKFEERTIESLTEKYAQGVEISGKSREVLDGFLAKDAEEGYHIFALEWFEANKDKIQKEKGVPVENVSDEWKINMVLSSKEKGGMGAAGEIRSAEYKDQLGDVIDRIGILRADLAKKPISPEAPFLMLNYLQGSIAEENKQISELRAKAEAGDMSAAGEANAKEAELEKLFLARKELTEKTMHENLVDMAEQKGFEPKDKYVELRINKKREDLQKERSDGLMNKELQAYNNLSEKGKKKYQSKLGVKLEESRKDFDKRTGGKGTDAEFQESNRQLFRLGLLEAAEKNGVKGPDVYGMLEQGYKPHEIKSKGFFAKKMIVGAREMSVDQFKNLAKTAGDDYSRKIEQQVRMGLENEWDKEHDKEVRDEIEKRISELAASPEAAEGGVAAVYEKARKRIVDGYIKARLEKNPKTKEEMEVVAKKLNKGGKDKNIGDLISETFSDEDGKFKGRLRNLRPWNKNMNRASFGAIKNYLSEDLGVKVDIETVKAVATEEKYNGAVRTKTGLFHLLLEIMMDQMGRKPAKKAGKKKAA